MIKCYLFLICLMYSSFSCAIEGKNEWNDTKLTDSTIKKVQLVQYQYKKCVADNMKKIGNHQIEVKVATGSIMKQCEQVLAKMRQLYLNNNVPSVIADRHLKKMRNDITRRVVKHLMFTAAARKAGAE